MDEKENIDSEPVEVTEPAPLETEEPAQSAEPEAKPDETPSEEAPPDLVEPSPGPGPGEEPKEAPSPSIKEQLLDAVQDGSLTVESLRGRVSAIANKIE